MVSSICQITTIFIKQTVPKSKLEKCFDQLNTIMSELLPVKPVESLDKNIRPSKSLIQVREKVELNFNALKVGHMLFYHKVLEQVTQMNLFQEILEFELTDGEKHLQILEVFDILLFCYLVEFLSTQQLREANPQLLQHLREAFEKSSLSEALESPHTFYNYMKTNKERTVSEI